MVDNLKHKEQILFLSGLYPKQFQEEILSNANNYIDNAANALQWKYVNGFDCLGWADTKLLNSKYIGSYPSRYKELFVKTRPFAHQEGASDIDIGFCNLKYYKVVSRFIAIKRVLRREIKNRIGNTNFILVAYSLTDTNARLLKFAKKILPSIKTVIIVPDLPEYMNTSNKESLLYSVLKSIEIKLIRRNMKYVDHYVFLTKAMAKFLKVKKDYFVCDGLVDDVKYVKPSEKSQDFNVVYTGSMHERYGVKNLVGGFMQVRDKRFRLILCGGGDSADYIKRCAEVDKRIIYKGAVRPKEIRKIQLSAGVLVNPRTNDEEFVKYSFPSKVLEYMSAGRPVLTYKLSSYSDVYDEFLIYVSEKSTDQVANIMGALIDLSKLPSARRTKIGYNCFRFVKENRTFSMVVPEIMKSVRQKTS